MEVKVVIMKLYERVSFAVNAMTKADEVVGEESESGVNCVTFLSMDYESTDFQYFGALNVGFAGFSSKEEASAADAREPRCIGGTFTKKESQVKYVALFILGATNEIYSVAREEIEQGVDGMRWDIKKIPLKEIDEWEADDNILCILYEKYTLVDDDTKAVKWLCGPVLKHMAEEQAAQLEQEQATAESSNVTTHVDLTNAEDDKASGKGNVVPSFVADEEAFVRDDTVFKEGEQASRARGGAGLNRLLTLARNHQLVAQSLKPSGKIRSDTLRELKAQKDAKEAAEEAKKSEATSKAAKKRAESRVMNAIAKKATDKAKSEAEAKRKNDEVIAACRKEAQLAIEREKEAAKKREQELLTQLYMAKRPRLDGVSLENEHTFDFDKSSHVLSHHPRVVTNPSVAARLHRLKLHEAQTKLARLKAYQQHSQAQDVADAEASVMFLTREEIISGYDQI